MSVRSEEGAKSASPPSHPSLGGDTLLQLGTGTTLAEILDRHSTSALKAEPAASATAKTADLKCLYAVPLSDSDLSVAAGVTAKDKRAKDAKNQHLVAPKVKKKRYAEATDCGGEGRVVRCDWLPYPSLPLALTLGQVLRLMEDRGHPVDWPCVHLTVAQSRSEC